MTMLEGLDRVDWGRLTHAYGKADGVPGMIRGLASPDASAREQAGRGLASTIFHQGSRYRASAPAVPFLLELLDEPGVAGKVPLINLVIPMAVGYCEEHLPFGFDPAKAFAPADELARSTDLEALRRAEPDSEEDFEPGIQNLWEKDTYEAVLRGIDVFHRLARDGDGDGDGDGEVRKAAVKALAWFPGAAAASIPIVREAARTSADPGERANATFALGILGHALGDRSDASWLGDRLRPEEPFGPRVAAAVSLAVLLREAMPEEALAVLLEVVAEGRGDAWAPEGSEASEGREAAWHGRGLTAQVSDALAAIRPSPTGPVLAALCRGAESLASPTIAQVLNALLTLVFPDPTPPTYERDPDNPKKARVLYRDPAALTDAQLRAVRAIGRNPQWEHDHPFIGDAGSVLWSFGLPSKTLEYRDYLRATGR